MVSNLPVGIEHIAYSLGEVQVTNDDLQRENPHWDMSKTFERTGVRSRPVASLGTTALDLACRAVEGAAAKSPNGLEDVDGLIFCTQTPDYLLPPNSTLLHGRLGMRSNVMAFDISHACSGFTYALGIAKSLVESGAAKRVLVVTADTYSRLIHAEDRSIRPLFGDGAAATIVSSNRPAVKILDMSFGTSGKHADRFIVRNGGFRSPKSTPPLIVTPDAGGRIDSMDHIKMDGLGVLSFFNNVVPTAVNELLAKHALSVEAPSHFVFHQASQLALNGIARSLKLPSEKMTNCLSDHGNLVSSSIPVALAQLIDAGSCKPGQFGVLCGFGVGLSWATALVQF